MGRKEILLWDDRTIHITRNSSRFIKSISFVTYCLACNNIYSFRLLRLASLWAGASSHILEGAVSGSDVNVGVNWEILLVFTDVDDEDEDVVDGGVVVAVDIDEDVVVAEEFVADGDDT